MDLPYAINATESKMHANKGFNMGALSPNTLICFGLLACCFMDDIMDCIGGLFDGLGDLDFGG